MLKGQDLIVLLSLIGRDRMTVRAIATELEWDQSGVHRSLGRLEEARLISQGQRPLLAQAAEFLVHGVPYAFPVRPGEMTRGIGTAWGVEPLVSALGPSEDPVPVWPHPLGNVRGVAIKPLHAIAFAASKRDAELAGRLALVDAIRSAPGARVRTLAADLLRERLRP